MGRCILCGAQHVRSVISPCDRKAQLFLLQTAFRANPQTADLAEAQSLLRWHAAKGA
jgi:hypothetical protein